VLLTGYIGVSQGRGCLGDRFRMEDCAVTNSGSIVIGPDWGGDSVVEMYGTTFRNDGRFGLGYVSGYNSSWSRVLVADSHLDIGGDLYLFGSSNNSRFVVSNSTVNVGGRIQTDSGGGFANCSFEMYQDPGKTTLVKVTGSNANSVFLGHNQNSPVMVYGGTLETVNDIAAADKGTDNYVGIIGTDSFVKCRDFICGIYNGTGLSLAITNGTLNCADLRIGDNSISTGARPNHVVISGEHARVNASGNVYVGYKDGVNNNRLFMDGGWVATDGGFVVGRGTSADNGVFIAGAGNLITAATFSANNNSRFEFTIPADGFGNPVFDIATTASVAGDTTFTINAEEFMGRATLVAAPSVTTDITNDNFTFNLPRNRRGRAYVGNDRINVLISAEETLLIIR